MSEQVYQIIITGKLLEGHSYDEVESALCRLLKLPVEKVRYLLRGERSRIKKVLPLETAERLQKKIEQRGAECQIELVKTSGGEASQEPLDLQKENSSNSASSAGSSGHSGLDDLDLDLPDEGGAETVVVSSKPSAKERVEGDEIVLATPKAVEKTVWNQKIEDDGTKAQFYDAPPPNKRAEAKEKATLPFSPVLLGVLLGVLILAGGGWYFLNMDDSMADPAAQATAPAVPMDPKKAATLKGLADIAKYVNVWMIQFGSGFNPSQVTLLRLQQDLDIPHKAFIDGWGQAYTYEALEAAFRLTSAGPDQTKGNKDDIHRTVKLKK